jgi:hypothetical protein
MSGIPDIGIFSAQVGYSRLACGRLEAWVGPHASTRIAARVILNEWSSN